MSVRVQARGDKDTLARFLGWFSLGARRGAAGGSEALARLVGAPTEGRGAARDARARRARGRDRQPGSSAAAADRWLWARVAGDALDLALLGLTAVRTGRIGRAAVGIGAVAGVVRRTSTRASGSRARGSRERRSSSARR